MSDVVFVFGAGFSGLAFAQLMLSRGATVHGTTRDPGKAERLSAIGIHAHVFDGETLPDAMIAALAETRSLAVTVGPGRTGDPVLAAARETIRTRMPKLEWIGYLSTVGVYGDHDGGWVDEDTPCRPVSSRSVERIETEAGWQGLGAVTGHPVAILRLSGIYGPGRNALVNVADGSARRIIKPGQVFNRIHVDDIAGALAFLYDRREGGVFNVTDDEPSPPQDVVEYACALMGVEPPPEVAFDDANLSEMGRSFYGEVKRVSNAKLKALGYSFRHPDYRTALQAMWTDGSWRGQPSPLQKKRS